MRLYIMRHGDAVNRAKTDAERPLSDLGKRQVTSMVQYLTEEPPTRLIASPYLRAQQSAKLIKTGLFQAGTELGVETIDRITPSDQPGKVIKQLEELQSERLMMVSHQPLVGSLITLLTEGEAIGIPVNTASIACLELEQYGIGQAMLSWMKSP